MTDAQKKEIQLLTEEYCKQFDSQAKAARTLKDVSEATIIHIRTGRWDGISDDKWRVVAKQVGYKSQLALVETLVFQTCYLYYDIAKEHGETFALIGRSGCGKSYAGKWYSGRMKGRNVYYLECAEYWNRKYFLQELIQAMGKSAGGMNIYEMMEYIISELRKQDHPLIILDEVDKLKDPVLLFFITLYNKLNKLCGFVWTSTNAIKAKIDKNLDKKVGYSELNTRVNGFIELPTLTRTEIRDLCHSRGITSDEEISRIYNTGNSNVRKIDSLYLKELVKSKLK